MNFPKEYITRDDSDAIIEGEDGNYYIGYIKFGSRKNNTAWGKYTMNSCEKPEWDLILCKKEKEVY